MKKFFLLPLMTLLTCVMAWGATRTAGTFAQLQDEIAAAAAGDVIELTADIAYPTNGTGLVNITKSITLDGKGHKLSGYGTANISVSGTQNWPVTLAVNYGGEASAALDVTIQNIHVSNEAGGTRSYGLMAWDGVDKLTLKNDSIYLGKSTANYRQVICITGTDATPLNLKIEDSYIGTSTRSGYPAYILKPINATLKNSEFNGYCGLYFKYRITGAYGNVVGTRGSVINADACAFICPNQHTSPSNNFAVFPLEDDGITFNLNNCSFNASTLGDTYQRFLNLQYLTRESGFQPVNVKLTGDNTHLYNVTANTVVFNGFSVGQYEPSINEGTCARVDVAINFTIEAGTFTFNPSNVHWYTLSDNKTAVFVKKNSSSNVSYEDQSEGSGAITIDLTKYQINEVKQGNKTLYRVVKKAEEKEPGVKYDLNDDVPTDVAGEGNNPSTSFELSDGSDMTLNQQVTKAGYVQVMDNGDDATTVTVGKASGADKDQKLIINNGLDVQGDSKVEVKAGSTLQIGEGGITTQKPENIVINADENGAASLLLDPTITVNQTPNLTVRMTAKQIGRDGEGDFYWHRFALPVAAGFTSWEKEGNLVPADPNYTVKYPTYLYAWDYANNDWANIAPNQMVPLQGYTLTLASDYIRVEGGKVVSEDTKNGNLTELQDVVYTFKGNLVGNEDQPLNFQHEGFNFFGNSYTGYMHVKTMLQGLVDAHIDGTAYMWNGDEQAYYGVSLHKLISGKGLEDWQQEVAPMQTFILRLRGANSADEEVKYAASIWGNPRYGHSATSAPRRAIATIDDDTYMEIAVKAANGKASRVDFTESANTSDAFESGYDVEKYMNEKTINLYATVNGMNLSSVVTDNIEGKTLSLKTNGEIAYTMSFKNVEGAEYAIRDNATGAVINIEEGATYEFAAQPNSTVEGRFEIVAAAKIPTSIDNTEVKANVKGIYTIMGQYLGENFDILPAGVYVVDGVKIVK